MGMGTDTAWFSCRTFRALDQVVRGHTVWNLELKGIRKLQAKTPKSRQTVERSVEKGGGLSSRNIPHIKTKYEDKKALQSAAEKIGGSVSPREVQHTAPNTMFHLPVWMGSQGGTYKAVSIFF